MIALKKFIFFQDFGVFEVFVSGVGCAVIVVPRKWSGGSLYGCICIDLDSKVKIFDGIPEGYWQPLKKALEVFQNSEIVLLAHTMEMGGYRSSFEGTTITFEQAGDLHVNVVATKKNKRKVVASFEAFLRKLEIKKIPLIDRRELFN